MSVVDRLSRVSQGELRDLLRRCCESEHWVERVAAERPFDSDEKLFERSREIWWELGADDWREEFAHHPRIGELQGDGSEVQATRSWIRDEQEGAAAASAATREALEQANAAYEERFGHVFVIAATGLSAEEILGRLRERLDNDPETELKTAADEQFKITRHRLEQLDEDGHGST